MLATLGRRQRRQACFLGGDVRALRSNRQPRTMTDNAQEGAAAAAAPDGAEQQQQQQQDVAAQVQQVTASLQELLKKPEAE